MLYSYKYKYDRVPQILYQNQFIFSSFRQKNDSGRGSFFKKMAIPGALIADFRDFQIQFHWKKLE